jgi:hypothetical protein
MGKRDREPRYKFHVNTKRVASNDAPVRVDLLTKGQLQALKDEIKAEYNHAIEAQVRDILAEEDKMPTHLSQGNCG